jgi:RNA polymerase sigma-70 factor, ECF subfamily
MADVDELLRRLAAGDRAALDELLASHRDAVSRYVDLRIDPQLRARVGVSDVVQEALLEVVRRIDDFLARNPMPFRVWVIKTAHEQLLRLRRRHVEAGCRAVGAEALDQGSVLLAGRLVDAAPTPGERLAREELARQVRVAVAELPDLDREVILLRTFEGLSNVESAQVLNIDPATATKRYTRALRRLREAMTASGLDREA